MAHPEAILGVDIGGTSVKLAAVDSSGRLHHECSVPTGRDVTGEDLVRAIRAAAASVLERQPVARVGVAAPGMRHADGERVVNVTNLPHIDGFPLRCALEEAFGLPVTLDNDANAAAMGEWRYGARADARRLLVLTVGTGIGAGMVVDGEVFRVACGGLGDPGHVIVDPDGPRCGCGARGCVEGLASVPAMLRRAAEGGVDFASYASLVEAGRDGDPTATRVLDESARWLGIALATLTHLLAPERILLGGGGVDAAGDPFVAAVERFYRAQVQPWLGERTALGRAALGNQAGIVGAAALAAP